MAEAPLVDVTLTERDAPVVLEELLPAQTQSYQLGMKLKLEIHEIEAIHTKYLDPRDRLLHIILAFLRQAEPRPTWRVIVDALRNPAVNLTALAEKVEAVHFPDPTATRLSSSGQVEEMVQRRIEEAMQSGTLQQRNVVGVITGPMGSGKTTLLCRLFGEPPPDLYTSTGVAEQSLRGLLHHTLHLSAGAWQRLSHRDIRKLLAPLIKAGMREADVDALTNTLSLTKPTSLPEKSATCKEMVPLVKSTASAAPTLQDLVLEMVHMIDTGGQPELLQVMPSFIHNADLAIALLNLEYSLSEHQQVDYHEKGEAYRRKTPFMVSGRDIILKLVSTLHGKKSLHEPFRLLIVATHRDCVEGDLEARVETLNRELRRLFLPAFEKELLLFGPNKIAFVLDLKNPDDSDKRALELIRREVGKPGLGKTFMTPISFFVFEQDLLQFAESEAKRDILSLDECKTVGAQLKMSQEMVVAALVLFHRQNTILYFCHVLQNHVFIKPQVPLDIINSIVAFRYNKLQGVPAKLVSQLEKGIITEKLLGYDQIYPHFQTGVYKVQDAIRLFCHTLTIAPLHHKEDAARPVPDSEREYLMMCLKPPIPDQDLHRHIPTSSDTVPLVVRFSSGCVPLGCFGSTISCVGGCQGRGRNSQVPGPQHCLSPRSSTSR